MGNVGLLRQGLEQFRHRAGEKAKALAVVIVAVELAAAEIRLIVDKVPRDAVALERKEPAVDAAPRKAHERPLFKVELLTPLVLHALVKRQDDAHAVSVCRERLRKAASHVGKAARLAKGGPPALVTYKMFICKLLSSVCCFYTMLPLLTASG